MLLTGNDSSAVWMDMDVKLVVAYNWKVEILVGIKLNIMKHHDIFCLSFYVGQFCKKRLPVKTPQPRYQAVSCS